MLSKIDLDWWWVDVPIKPIAWWVDCPYFFMPRIAAVLCGVEVLIFAAIFCVWRYNRLCK